MTHEEAVALAQKGWAARFPKTPWPSMAQEAREKQVQMARDVALSGVASSEMEHWYLRALRGEFDAAQVVADKPQSVPVAVVVEKPGAKKPTKKEK